MSNQAVNQSQILIKTPGILSVSRSFLNRLVALTLIVLTTVSIAGTLSVLNSGKVNAATFTGGLPQIFLQKHISPQLRNAASALWLGN